ncbi:hypothetical protein ACLQ22_02920 [Micromonospora sp. DT178]|uniref:hypothetical protein n=1 Tax=Micromonospora sp. DT178 TaxID=3393436 RepID=UPI003CF8431F
MGMFCLALLCLVGKFMDSVDGSDGSPGIASNTGSTVQSSVKGAGTTGTTRSEDWCLSERRAYYKWQDHYRSVMAAELMPTGPELENLRREVDSYVAAVPSGHGQEAAVLTAGVLHYREVVVLAVSGNRNAGALDRIVTAAADVDRRHLTFAASCED